MDSFFTLDLSRNYSYYTVPVAFLTAAVPHMYAITSSKMHYDNANPRSHPECVAKSDILDKVTVQRILRARAASANGFETLGFFAAAVVAANAAGVPAMALNLLSSGYVASRVVYGVAYVWLCTDRRRAAVRSVTWAVGVAVVMALWVKAAGRAVAF